ncbi:hypothetical protein MTR67_042424, partial [Solanum verrucosum]
MERCMKSKLPPAGPKLERKYVEKNRRNYMKNLYNQLHSLLPASKVCFIYSFHFESLRCWREMRVEDKRSIRVGGGGECE